MGIPVRPDHPAHKRQLVLFGRIIAENTGDAGQKIFDCGLLPVTQIHTFDGILRLDTDKGNFGFDVFFYKFHDCRKGQGMC